MRKLNLIAMAYERDGILSVLQETNAVEVREHTDTAHALPLPAGGEELRGYLASLEDSLSLLTAEAESYASEHKLSAKIEKDGFEVGYTAFLQAGEQKEEMDQLAAQVNALVAERNELLAESGKLQRARISALPYQMLTLSFDSFADTLHTRTRLGTLPVNGWDAIKRGLDEIGLTACLEWVGEDTVLVAVTSHRSVSTDVERLLQEGGFVPCPYHGEMTGAEFVASLEEQISAVIQAREEAEKKLFSLAPRIRDLKIYCDYVAFCLEREETSGKLRGTERTFLMEAFVPESEERRVAEALHGASGAIYYEFSDPAEDEQIPTLLKNNPVVENFETITNMYSVPNARELDPNTVMSFFYSFFLGFIMADIGYGILMLLGGGFLYFKQKRGGMKSLAGVFAVCGVFTIFWGILFNSLLGIQIFPVTVMPDAQTQMYNLAGIALPGVLVISLLLGIVQLMAGYLCRAAQCWRRGAYLDGIFEGGVWAVFSLGAGLAVTGLIEEFNLSVLTLAGGILAGASLLVAVFTAGRKEKFLGKLTKGFGSLYGLINYFTDVLSYIRLYGLMLTGAVIAQVVSQYAVGFITSGSVLIVLGILLMIVGHVFNLAIGLLGAYIHTARLQYVEFFGRFYEGEGELFTPLGSRQKYIWLERN